MNGEVRSETVFSVLTPTGRGAVAVVAVRGPRSVAAVDGCFLAKNRRPLIEQPISRIVYGHWGSTAGEDLIVCRRDSDHLEIHCHGGLQSVATITGDLTTAGCCEINWQDWLHRQGDCDLTVEARIALSQATSQRTATILLDQFQGSLKRELTAICELLSRGDVASARPRLESLLATATLGLHLTRPWQVVIAGKPNVGKSSLINALVGYQRAIVFDQPGTTRDVVTASTIIDGWPVVLSDTAGLHDSTDELEAAGTNLARERLATADLVVWVLDAAETYVISWQEIMDREVAELGLSLPGKRLLVLNKIDRAGGIEVSSDAIATSATTGAGIDELLNAISTTLVPKVPLSGGAMLFTMRQQAAVQSVLIACQHDDTRLATELLGQMAAC